MKTKKGLKSVIILVAVLILLFTVACAEQPRDVSGQYETVFDFDRYLAEGQMAEFEENGLGFINDLQGRYELILNADGTFDLSFDSEKFKEDIFAALKDNRDAIFKTSMERNGVEEKEYEVFAKRAGYDSVDALKDSMISKMEEEIANSEGFKKLEQKNAHGTYTVKKVKTSYEDGNYVVKQDVITFEMGEGNLQYDRATVYENGNLYIQSFFGQDEHAEFSQY